MPVSCHSDIVNNMMILRHSRSGLSGVSIETLEMPNKNVNKCDYFSTAWSDMYESKVTV